MSLFDASGRQVASGDDHEIVAVGGIQVSIPVALNRAEAPTFSPQAVAEFCGRMHLRQSALLRHVVYLQSCINALADAAGVEVPLPPWETPTTPPPTRQ